jgi:penicillin-binding protein 1A
LAAGGKEVVPTLIDSVQDRDGHVVERASGLECTDCGNPDQPPVVTDNRAQIADPDSVYQLVTMMQDVVKRGTGTEAGKGLNRPIAGKTGTSQDFVDAWFSGFTPDLVTTVWVGYDNPASLGNNETGGAVAAPVWHDYMATALKDRPVLNFPQPPGVTLATYNFGGTTITDAFKPDQAPGASVPIGEGLLDAAISGGTDNGGGPRTDGSGGAGSGAPANAGVDSGLGGLY